MTKSQKVHIWFEKVILRGIEGVIGDAYLKGAMDKPGLGGLENFFEAKYMAEQVYAQCRKWGL